MATKDKWRIAELIELLGVARERQLFPWAPRGLASWGEEHRGEFIGNDGGVLMLAYTRSGQHEWRAYIELRPASGEATAIDILNPCPTPEFAMVTVLERHRQEYGVDLLPHLREAVVGTNK